MNENGKSSVRLPIVMYGVMYKRKVMDTESISVTQHIFLQRNYLRSAFMDQSKKFVILASPPLIVPLNNTNIVGVYLTESDSVESLVGRCCCHVFLFPFIGDLELLLSL